MSLLREIALLAHAWQAADGMVAFHLRQHRHDGQLVQRVLHIFPYPPVAAMAHANGPPMPEALAELLARAPCPLLLTADTTLAAVALPRRGEIAFDVPPGTPTLLQDDLPDGLWTLLPSQASAHLRLAHAADALAPERLPLSLRFRLDAARNDRPAGKMLVRGGRAVALLHLPPRPLLLRVR